MRTRRQRLQVSTFPFLAVLLCAMGSLILLLLVIDRRAKEVARAKALQAAQKLQAEIANTSGIAEAEMERRRKALHEVLTGKDLELLNQVKSVRTQGESTAKSLQVEEALNQELLARLQAEAGRLSTKQVLLKGRLQGLEKDSEKNQAGRAELLRMTAELKQMERVIADLKAVRQRDKQTYSLVPYHGHKGDNRQPLYVECTQRGLVFHPDRKSLEGPEMSPSQIRAEVEQRILAQQGTTRIAGQPAPESPYLLMLVRPDGIVSYYQTLAALNDLKVDFGYEFIEPDWVLDFPRNDDEVRTQPWMTAKKADPSSPATLSPPQGMHQSPMLAGLAHEGNSSLDGWEGMSGTKLGSKRSPGNETSSGISPSGSLAGFSSGPSGPFGSNSANQVGFGQPGGILPGPGVGLSSSGFSSATRTGGTFPGSSQGIGKGNGDRLAGFAANGPESSLLGATTGNPKEAGGSMESLISNGQKSSGPALGPPTTTGISENRPSGSWVELSSPGNSGPNRVAGLPSTGKDSGGLSGQGGGESTPRANSKEMSRIDKPGQESFLPGKTQTQEFPKNLGEGATPTIPTQGDLNSRPNPDGSQPVATTNPNSGTPIKDDGFSKPQGYHGLNSGGAVDQGREGDGLPQPFSQPIPQGLIDPKPTSKPVRPSLMKANRDWVISIECTATAVVVYPFQTQISLETLSTQDKNDNGLLQAVRRLIERRQATVFPGEPPYRPLVRFLVRPDALQSYYIAFPCLEPLHIPMTHEDLEKNEDIETRLSGR